MSEIRARSPVIASAAAVTHALPQEADSLSSDRISERRLLSAFAKGHVLQAAILTGQTKHSLLAPRMRMQHSFGMGQGERQRRQR